MLLFDRCKTSESRLSISLNIFTDIKQKTILVLFSRDLLEARILTMKLNSSEPSTAFPIHNSITSLENNLNDLSYLTTFVKNLKKHPLTSTSLSEGL